MFTVASVLPVVRWILRNRARCLVVSVFRFPERKRVMRFFKLGDVCRNWRNMTPAKVLALTIAMFPTSFALAGGRQVAEQQAETLVEEILGLENSVSVINHGDGSATVFDGDTRLEYLGVVRHRNGEVSGRVEEFMGGRFVSTHVLQPGFVISPNKNTIEFDVESTTADGRLSETSGSIKRMTGGGALLQVEKADGVEASTMTFSAPSTTSRSVASLLGMISVVPVGMSAKALTLASVAGCAIVIAVVVLAVVILCIFGYFPGC